MNNLLGLAIGRALCDLDNLNAVYLPLGLDRKQALVIAESANSRRTDKSGGPFAIAVDASRNILFEGQGFLSPQDAIAWREGARLAVFTGTAAAPVASLETFIPVLRSTFPARSEIADGVFSLEDLAEALLVEIFTESGLTEPDIWNRATVIARLANAMSQLGSFLEQVGSGHKAWNVHWYESVDAAASLLSAILKSEGGVKAEEVFEKCTFACFGLPRPVSGTALHAKSVGSALSAALEEYWSDSQAASESARALSERSEVKADVHPFQGINWDAYEEYKAESNNAAVGWIRQCTLTVERTLALAELTEPQFLNPFGNEASALEVVAETGESLDVVQAGVAILLGSSLEVREGKRYIRTEPFVVRARLGAMVTPEACSSTGLSLRMSGQSFVEIESVSIVENDLCLEIHAVVFAPIAQHRFVHKLRTQSVEISIPVSDPLFGAVKKSMPHKVLVTAPNSVGIAIWNGSDLGKTPSLVGDTVFSAAGAPEEPETSYELSFKESGTYKVLLWGGNKEPDSDPAASFMNFRPLPTLWVGESVIESQLDIAAEGRLFELTIDEPVTLVHSPIQAAAAKHDVEYVQPTNELFATARGQFEAHILDQVATPAWSQSLGHLVMPADSEGSARQTTYDSSAMVSVASSFAHKWRTLLHSKVSRELAESAEVTNFQEKFEALPIVHSLRDGSQRRDQLLLSGFCFRRLKSRPQLLDDYLDAYRAMVTRAAQSSNAFDLFWATYPFSVSVWSAEDFSCRAVLMSPLHPLRLHWIASVEQSLFESAGVESLFGTIEGWNFPYVGPAEQPTKNFVANPIDTGLHQTFIGWSMLTAVSSGFPAALSPLERIGDCSAPGSAASGINASSVVGALNSYHRVNPNVSTLSMDLRASKAAPRVAELDQAVIETVANWRGGSGAGLSGVRIYDSSNRLGQIPREQIVDRLGDSDLPFTWQRYSNVTDVAVNVRILQDAGINVSVQETYDGDLSTQAGLLSVAGLRRFDVTGSAAVVGAISRIDFQLSCDADSDSFSLALSAVESARTSSRIATALTPTVFGPLSADWTVSGESFISPSALAALLKAGSSNAPMLWEWRPPFLAKASKEDSFSAMIERRPYITVARVPETFKSMLRAKLVEVARGDQVETKAEEVLGTLGTRGVGLSSLMSIGGSHAAGALGFYTAYKLLELVDSTDVDELVLPIDACEKFLSALGNHSEGASRQRADLLHIKLESGRVILSPIEIKFYGSGVAADEITHLRPTKSAVAEALEQLESTVKLLQSVKNEWDAIRLSANAHSRAIWVNGLATLLDAGVRLSPSAGQNRERLLSSFSAILREDFEIAVGRPLLTYFMRNAVDPEGATSMCEFPVGPDVAGSLTCGALFADPAEFIQAGEGIAPQIAVQLRQMLNWATTVDSSSDSGSELPVPLVEVGLQPEIDEQSFTAPEAIAAPPAKHTQSESASESTSSQAAADTEQLLEPLEGLLLDGVKFPIGQLIDAAGQTSVELWLGNTALNQLNMGVVGDLGTGKTQLLKSLILQIRRSSSETQPSAASVLILDYKGDFQDQDFLQAVGGRVLDPENLPLNILQLPEEDSAQQRFKRAQAVFDLLKRIFAGVGPVQQGNLNSTIMGLYDSMKPKTPTLADVYDAYPDVDGLKNVLGQFVLGGVLDADAANCRTLDELIEGKVLVVALNKLGVDQQMKNALVALFLNEYYAYMLSRPKWPYQGTNPQLRRLNSFLLIDEAQNIMKYQFPVLEQIMLQGREFGIGTILASQYLTHFKQSEINYGEPLHSWFIHKVPSVKKSELTALGISDATDQDALKIKNLGNHQAYFKSLAYAGRFIRGLPYFELRAKDD